MNNMNFDPTRGPHFPPLPATAGDGIATSPPAYSRGCVRGNEPGGGEHFSFHGAVAEQGGGYWGPRLIRPRPVGVVAPLIQDASNGPPPAYLNEPPPPYSAEFLAPADDGANEQAPPAHAVANEQAPPADDGANGRQSIWQLFEMATRMRPLTCWQMVRISGFLLTTVSVGTMVTAPALIAISGTAAFVRLGLLGRLMGSVGGACMTLMVPYWLDRAVTSLPDHLPGRLKEGIKGWLLRAGVLENVDSVDSLDLELRRSGGITKRKVARLATFTAVAAVSEVAMGCAGFAIGGLLPFGGAAYAGAVVGAASVLMCSKQLEWVEKKITSFWSPRDGACAPETALAGR